MLGGSGGLDVTRRRKVVVVLGNLLDASDLDEALYVSAGVKGVGDFLDCIVGGEVLRPPFLELVACIDEDDLTPAVLGLLAVENSDDARSSGLVSRTLSFVGVGSAPSRGSTICLSLRLRRRRTGLRAPGLPRKRAGGSASS